MNTSPPPLMKRKRRKRNSINFLYFIPDYGEMGEKKKQEFVALALLLEYSSLKIPPIYRRIPLIHRLIPVIRNRIPLAFVGGIHHRNKFYNSFTA